MNQVTLIGRLTKDPETRTTEGGLSVCNFALAIDRPARRDGTHETDFPRVIVMGNQAENCGKYLAKGRLVGVSGRVQTGSYTNREGVKVYTTEIYATYVEFLEWGEKREAGQYDDRGGYHTDGGGNFGNRQEPPQNFSDQPERIPGTEPWSDAWRR